MNKPLLRQVFLLGTGLAIVLSWGCDRKSSSPTAESRPAEKAEQTSGQLGDNPKPGGARNPTSTHGGTEKDRADAETERADAGNRVPARFSIDGSPYQEERHREKLTARKSAEFPLRASPDPEAEIVDHLSVDEGEEIEQPGDSHLFITAEKRPSPVSLVVSPESHRAGPKPDNPVHIEKGDSVAFYGHYIGTGSWRFYLWHDGARYAGEPRDFGTSGTTFQKFDIPEPPNLAILEGDASSWWIEVEGPEAKGWMRADRDEIQIDIVSTGP